MHSLTYAQAINEALKEEMRRDANLVVLGEDVGKYGGVFGVTRGLYDEFGEARVRDCPLNEAAIISFGIGLALAGKPAVAELEFMDFVTFCMDAITNQAPKLRFFWGGQVEVPLVIRTPIASGLGFGTQHSQSLEGWFMHVPGLKVAMPATAYDAKGLMKTAIRDRNPVLFADNISLYSTKGDIPDEDYTIPFGQAEVKREGDDVTVVALGAMVPQALTAAEELAGQGLSVEVIDPRTLAPFDIETIIASVEKTGRVVVALVATRLLPPLAAHVNAGRARSPLAQLRAVVGVANHWRAFSFILALMMAGFTVIPFIAAYLVANVAVHEDELALVYMAGGVATLVTAQVIGRLADRYGKKRVFTIVALASTGPILLVTHLPALPLGAVLAVSTLFFILVPGRFGPAMALVSGSAEPRVRGSFMSLNAAMMQMGSGIAASVSGAVVSRSRDGTLAGFGHIGWIAVGFTLLAIVLAWRVRVVDRRVPDLAGAGKVPE